MCGAGSSRIAATARATSTDETGEVLPRPIGSASSSPSRALAAEDTASTHSRETPPPGHWVSGLASQLSLIANTLQQGELHNAVQNLAGRVIRKGAAEAAPGADPVLGSAASARAPQPLTTAFRNALAVDGAALVDLDGTFRKIQRGGT